MPSPREQPTPPGKNRRRPEVMPGSLVWIVILLLVMSVLFFTLTNGRNDIDYTDFVDLVKKGQVEKVQFLGRNRVVAELKENAKVPESVSKVIRTSRKVSTLLTESDV